MCIHTKERHQMAKNKLRKHCAGSVRLNTERKLKMFLKSALKLYDQNLNSYRCYVVVKPPLTEYPEPMNKKRNLVLIYWNDQWIICSDTRMNIQRWLKKTGIEPECMWINTEAKYTDKRHMWGTYRQYSDRTIVERKWLNRDQLGYDPMLERIHDTLDKFNVDIEWKR